LAADIVPFGHLPDGRVVHRLGLRSGGMHAHVLTLGAIVQDLRLQDIAHPLVLGADHLGPYLGPMRYFGASVGRYANRIAHGRFMLKGQAYALSRNALGRHCLHGGTTGCAEKLWQVVDVQEHRATLAITLPDGDMGFPGQLDISLTISLSDGALNFDYGATSDRDTVCSLSHHGYFVLDDSGSLAQHQLRVAADHYLPVDDDLIPTGQIAPVTGSAFDFRTMRSLQDVALDHNFCLSPARTALRPVAWLHSALSGVQMRVETTEPGLQVYTANHLPQAGVTGLDGRPLGRHAGVALEAQGWPDAPNQPDFPDATLRAGEPYRHQTRYVFNPRALTEPA
jgi:aldose 1-epimerase